MDIFRYENSIPEVYVSESRDFQVLTRLLTFGLGSAKNNSDMVKYLNNPTHINSNLLKLLQTKVGFLTNKQFTDAQLRAVLGSFVTMTKNKGSVVGILQAIYLFFSASNLYTNSIVSVTQNDSINSYEVRIALKTGFSDFSLLQELLNFVLPAGHKLCVYFYSDEDTITRMFDLDTVTWYSTEINGDKRYTTIVGTVKEGTEQSKTIYGRLDTISMERFEYVGARRPFTYDLAIDDQGEVKGLENWSKQLTTKQ